MHVRLALFLASSLLFGCGSPQPVAASSDRGLFERHAELATGIDARWVELGDPRGPAVLFLHGYTDTSRSFLPTMRALTALRPELRLIALDQRGHGGSSLPAGAACPGTPERCFELADLAGDALALLDREGLERAFVVGHSMGSAVAQELALGHPERVERLVLIATSPRIGASPFVRELLRDGLVEGAWKQAVEARGLRFPEDAWERRPRDVDPEAPAWLAEVWVAEPGADRAQLEAILPETGDVPLGTWIGALRMQIAQDTRARLGSLRVPTLVLAPIQDAAFPEEPHQRELRASLQRAGEQHGTPWWWKRYGRREAGDGPQDDLGHNLHWAASEPVARDLAAFLRSGGAPTDELSYLELDRLRVEPNGALVLGQDRSGLPAPRQGQARSLPPRS